MRRSGEVPALLMGDPDLSVVLALLHSMNPWQGDPYRAAMARAREVTGRPVLVVSPGGLPEAERATYASIGMDVFTETDIVLEGIGAMLTPPPAPVPTVAAMPTQAQLARQLTEPESLALLQSFGVPVVATSVCASVDQARAAAERIGYPVVLKGVAGGVAHKSDLGLVHVGLRDAASVARAYNETGCAIVVVQAMVVGDLEAIAGVTRADGVGIVLLAGLGGVYAEALRDIAMWPIPTDRETIEHRLHASALGRVLTGPRWKHPGAVTAFVDLLLALQTAAVSLGGRLHAIDINPVILGAHGAVGVDALVVPSP
jgi:acyl-CoA synthetase (NDP forming)